MWEKDGRQEWRTTPYKQEINLGKIEDLKLSKF
jgi:hypothetical protein